LYAIIPRFLGNYKTNTGEDRDYKVQAERSSSHNLYMEMRKAVIPQYELLLGSEELTSYTVDAGMQRQLQEVVGASGVILACTLMWARKVKTTLLNLYDTWPRTLSSMSSTSWYISFSSS
jgi:hypothetical protein